MAEATASANLVPGESAEHETGQVHTHIVPMKVLVTIWLSLVCLTVLTVVAANWDFGGSANLWIAMAIAVTKGSLVALYFMHLRYDNPFYGVIFIIALIFVTLFIGLAMMDSLHYDAQQIPNYAPLIHH